MFDAFTDSRGVRAVCSGRKGCKYRKMRWVNEDAGLQTERGWGGNGRCGWNSGGASARVCNSLME